MTTEAHLDAAARALIPTLEIAADNWTRPDEWPSEPELRKLKARRRRLAAHLNAVETEARRLWNDYKATGEQIAEIDEELARIGSDE